MVGLGGGRFTGDSAMDKDKPSFNLSVFFMKEPDEKEGRGMRRCLQTSRSLPKHRDNVLLIGGLE